ncbi:MAG: ATP-binding protein [Proteobacteria bacterium]|nr:ATP-binding protein [Pseudomonadota bacterium]
MLCTNLLAISIQANISTLLVGDPGVGKTAILEALVEQLQEKKYGGKDFPLVITNAAQAMPEDLGGAQVPNHETRTMDAYSMGAIKALIKAGRGVHFLDEYGSCGPQMRAACLSVFEGRVYGDVRLSNVCVVAAMNPPSIATNGQDMSLPESNRPFWIEWAVDDSAWFDYLLGGKGAVSTFPILPDDFEKTHLPKTRSLVAMYLKRNPKSIHVQPPPEKATSPWPSRRSWTNAAKMFAAVLAAGFAIESDEVHGAVKGFVGQSHADEFFRWVKDMDLPDPEALLASPKNAFGMIPNKHDRAIACLESVAAAAIEDRPNKVNRWAAAWEILEPVINSHQDRAMSAGAILATRMPAGAMFPPVAAKILKVRRDMGISKAGI